jgi:hypothetical protein
MNVRDFVYDADAYWCDAGKLYFERHVPSSVDTVGELETHLLNDADYESRMLGLHTEVGSPVPNFNSASRAVATVRIMKKKEGVIERCGDLVATDDYRLVRGNVVYSGTLDECNNVDRVQYDSSQWWFARGIDGTVLNDAAEVTAYTASVVRERKHYDSVDDLTVWLA